MTKIFLDTNVFLDFLLDRGEFAEPAEKLLLWCKNERLQGYTSTVSFANIYYLVSQQKSKAETSRVIKNLLGFIGVPQTTKKDLILAVESNFADFEDAVQYYSAMNIDGMNFILTRNKKDFKASIIPVVTPAEFISLYDSKL